MAMICDRCKGEVYPRQCRNSAAWRRAQGPPDECPHGIELNNLPIGDNLPAESVYRGRDACEFLAVMPTGGCCDNETYCTRGGRRRIRPHECAQCDMKKVGASG